MFPGANPEDMLGLRDIFLAAQHYVANSGRREKPQVDRGKERKKLLKRFESWQVVKSGRLDLRQGERFRHTLEGHTAYLNHQKAKRQEAKPSRSPFHQDVFAKLEASQRRAFKNQADEANIVYRQNLLQDYKRVYEIENLPPELTQSGGPGLAELRADFLAASSGRWTDEEASACVTLKNTLQELVEIVCCAYSALEAFEEDDDPRASVPKHASRALTPYLPLCSDQQIKRVAMMMGEVAQGEYVFHFMMDVFAAWDIKSECPWVWDILLELVADISKDAPAKSDLPSAYIDLTHDLWPILMQNEPWGGDMYDEYILACAVALCYDKYGLRKIQDEEGRGIGGLVGDPETRRWINASLFSELKRLHVADANNLVLEAFEKDAILPALDGNYQSFVEEVGIPASNERIIAAARSASMETDCAPGTEPFRRILRKQKDQLQASLQKTGKQTPEAIAKEKLAEARRKAFEAAVKTLLKKRTLTAADIRTEVARYKAACKMLEEGGVPTTSQASAESSDITAAGSTESTDPKATKACDQCNQPPPDGEKLLRCSRCRKARYCGKECQATAWRAGGHKQVCTPAAS